MKKTIKMYECFFCAEEISSVTVSPASETDADGVKFTGVEFGGGRGRDCNGPKATQADVTTSPSLPSPSSLNDHDFELNSVAATTSAPTPSSSSSSSLVMMPTPQILSSYIQQDSRAFSASYDALLLRELFDRASSLLQRESSHDYAVMNYFLRRPAGYALRSPTLNRDAAAPASSPFNSSSSSSSCFCLHFDSKCREIMMDWAFRVVEFILRPVSPPDSRQSHSECRKGQFKPRLHSFQVILLVSKAFSFVDRICTKFDMASRDQYKLLTMVCLHLAIKTGGLLKSDDQVYDHHFDCKSCSSSRDNVASTSSSALLSSYPSTSTSSTSPKSTIVKGSKNGYGVESNESTLPVPYAQVSIRHEKEEDQVQRIKQDERVWLLSLQGLRSLCNDEFTMDQFTQMEYFILNYGLNWRLNSVLALDWIDVYLELMMLLPPPGLQLFRDNESDSVTNRTRKFTSLTKEACDNIRDATLIQLERALKRSHFFLSCAPSLLGLAAFLNSTEGLHSICNDDCDYILESLVEEALGIKVDGDDLNDFRMMMMYDV